MLAVGTAANAVTLSDSTTKLWVGPGRITDALTEFCVLLTIASLLSEGLTTRVSSRFGVSAIIPASLILELKDASAIVYGDNRSFDASTTFSTGKPPPNPVG